MRFCVKCSVCQSQGREYLISFVVCTRIELQRSATVDCEDLAYRVEKRKWRAREFSRDTVYIHPRVTSEMDSSAIAASAQALSNILIQRGISIGQQVQHQRASEPSTIRLVSSGVPPRVPQAQPQPVYSYKVKVINPEKKREVIVRQLNKFTFKFESVLDVRLKIIGECGEHVPNTVDYNVGFYDGSKQAKVWIVNDADLQTMYNKHPNGGNITLWSDGLQVHLLHHQLARENEILKLQLSVKKRKVK